MIINKYVLLVLVALSCQFLWVSELNAKQDRPNIIWITSEDNSMHWYRLYNPENGAPMPNVEKMAAHGLVFNNAYSNAPVCSTARSTIISGCYGPRLGTQYHRRQMFMKFPEGIKPFPYYLRKAGYYTTNNSKEDYNFEKSQTQEAWDVSSRRATYKDRKPDQPFFHVFNITRTHESGLFKKKETKTDPAKVDLFPYHPDTILFRHKYAQYLDSHMAIDKDIGETIDSLDKEGLLDDTFIFHYGDHGGVLPGSKGYAYNDGLQVALVVYVPKNWKHLAPAEKGTRIDGIVEFVDLSATVLNLAGLERPKGIDGRPFLGKGVSLEDLNKRDSAIGYAERFDEKYDMVRFLRKRNFTYMRSYQPFNFDGLHAYYRYNLDAFREWRDLANEGKLNEAQTRFFKPRPVECLFDLSKDPHEVNNLAADPKYATILNELRMDLQDRLKAMPDLGFIPEPVLIEECKGDGYSYGMKQKKRLAELINLVDLQLRPFAEAKKGIDIALKSEDPLKRYWALINCSAFGEQAAVFYNIAKLLAKNDNDKLVRTRAVEFLGLTKQIDPKSLLVDILKDMDDKVAINLVLNTVVLLKDMDDGYDINKELFAKMPWVKASSYIERRLNYLDGQEGLKNPKLKTKKKRD